MRRRASAFAAIFSMEVIALIVAFIACGAFIVAFIAFLSHLGSIAFDGFRLHFALYYLNIGNLRLA